MRNREESTANVILVLMLLTDALFVVIHIFYVTLPFVDDNRFRISEDRGLAEAFQYVKAYWAGLLFAWLAWRTREWWYLVWSALFAYLGADDALKIHEDVGVALSDRLGYPDLLGLRGQDFGELTIFALAGAFFLPLLLLAYLRGSDPLRRATRRLVVLIALFAGFGIVVDALSVVFLDSSAHELFAVTEDGGEMAVLSIILWYVFRLVFREPSIDPADPGAISSPEELIRLPGE